MAPAVTYDERVKGITLFEGKSTLIYTVKRETVYTYMNSK